MVVAVGALASCGASPATKAGGEATLTLRMADGYAVPELEPAVAAFVDGVRQRSKGLLRVDVTRSYGDFQPNFEQQVVKAVAAGDFDLAWAGTRVLDTLGVTSFQALTAPMLIDSYPLQDAVFRSGIPNEMLPGLDRVGVTGLAVLAGGLRKPVAVARPLRGPRDWRGLTFAALRSDSQARTIRALGATPADVVTTALDEGLQRGTIGGFEKNLLIYASNNNEPSARYVTANVNLWPETAVLLANPGTLGRLTTEQTEWVRAAAADAAARSAALADADQTFVTEGCRRGARFAVASPADLAAMQAAVAPVIAGLEKDPQTEAFINRIRGLKRATPKPSTVQVPAGCMVAGTSGDPAGSGSSGPSSVAPPLARELVGTWLTEPIAPERIRATFQKAGGTAEDASRFVAELGARNGEQFGLELTATTWREFEVSDGGSPATGWYGSYSVDGTTVRVFGSGGCRIDYRASLTGDRLALTVLSDTGASPVCGPADLVPQRAIYETAPFIRLP
jgi:TRAP-type C4-dicarboxylate transport system substrate-binding protein